MSDRPETIMDTYLGDGAYAGVDAQTGELVIWAPREHGDHWVVLDGPMVDQLFNVWKRLKTPERQP